MIENEYPISSNNDIQLFNLWGTQVQEYQSEYTHYYCTQCKYNINNKYLYEVHMSAEHNLFIQTEYMQQEYDQYQDEPEEYVATAYGN